MTRLPIRETPEGSRFHVRVTPQARRTALLGIAGEGEEAVLRIAIEAPPLEGRANAALIEFLAELLQVSRGSIEIAGGQHGRNKAVVVRGRAPAQIASMIDQALPRK